MKIKFSKIGFNAFKHVAMMRDRVAQLKALGYDRDGNRLPGVPPWSARKTPTKLDRVEGEQRAEIRQRLRRKYFAL